jgi:hypothetical protein
MTTLKNSLKKILKPFLPEMILRPFKKLREKKEIEEWKNNWCPSPPPHIVKQITVGDYQRKSGYTTLIETGTYMGEMVQAQKSRFEKIFSVELAVDLFNQAQKRFHNEKHISIIKGDSGKMLSAILKRVTEPAIFWLDGHYSGDLTAKGEKECPIFEELGAIFNHKKLNHILLIDDARCFTGEGDYPKVDELAEFVKKKNKHYQIEVKHDIIRFESKVCMGEHQNLVT